MLPSDTSTVPQSQVCFKPGLGLASGTSKNLALSYRYSPFRFPDSPGRRFPANPGHRGKALVLTLQGQERDV